MTRVNANQKTRGPDDNPGSLLGPAMSQGTADTPPGSGAKPDRKFTRDTQHHHLGAGSPCAVPPMWGSSHSPRGRPPTPSPRSTPIASAPQPPSATAQHCPSGHSQQPGVVLPDALQWALTTQYKNKPMSSVVSSLVPQVTTPLRVPGWPSPLTCTTHQPPQTLISLLLHKRGLAEQGDTRRTIAQLTPRKHRIRGQRQLQKNLVHVLTGMGEADTH